MTRRKGGPENLRFSTPSQTTQNQGYCKEPTVRNLVAGWRRRLQPRGTGTDPEGWTLPERLFGGGPVRASRRKAARKGEVTTDPEGRNAAEPNFSAVARLGHAAEKLGEDHGIGKIPRGGHAPANPAGIPRGSYKLR